MSVSLRTMAEPEREQREAEIAGRWADASPHLDERSRRVWLGAEARQLGYGGIKFVAEATGAAIETVRSGIADLGRDPRERAGGRVRRQGGGRKKSEDGDPGLPAALDGLLGDDESEAGDPMTPRLRWTSKSLVKLSGELRELGHPASPSKVRGLMYRAGWRLQSNNKSMAKSAPHPDRNAQFGYINQQVAAFAAAGQPVTSVDTKKKELVGEFKNNGREWHPKGAPAAVSVHDFKDPTLGKVNPYGVYDVTADTGWVSVGVDHDTSAFAVNTIRSWWENTGRYSYPGAKRLLITADGGGSNGYRTRLWKVELARLAAETGLAITVCHLPPGTSKWNKIEHRLFSRISINWRARPLTSREVIVNTIGATTTASGTPVEAVLDTNEYPAGIKIPDKQMRELESTGSLARHDWHGEWNYTLNPTRSE